MNIIITALICFRLLRAQRVTVSALRGSKRHTYTRVVILVEAALPVAIFGIAEAILLVIPRGDTTKTMSDTYLSQTFFCTFYFMFTVREIFLLNVTAMLTRLTIHADPRSAGNHLPGCHRQFIMYKYCRHWGSDYNHRNYHGEGVHFWFDNDNINWEVRGALIPSECL